MKINQLKKKKHLRLERKINFRKKMSSDQIKGLKIDMYERNHCSL